MTAVQARLRAAQRLADACVELDNGYLRCLLCRASCHREDGKKNILHSGSCRLLAFAATAITESDEPTRVKLFGHHGPRRRP